MSTQVIQVDTQGFRLDCRTNNGRDEVWNLNGVSWAEARLPRRWHRCRPQTKIWLNFIELHYRCACGAMGENWQGTDVWVEKNQRRRTS